MKKNDTVLFVHPRHMSYGRDSQVPMGFLGLLNAAPAPARALFENEVSDNDLRSAAVLAMDIFWYMSLSSAVALARRCRTVNPSLFIVAGGYTATVYAAPLVKDFDFDAVVLGDAEGPFPELVKALREARDLHNVPNLRLREKVTPWSYALTQEDYDSFDYLSLSRFPSLLRLARESHRYEGARFVYPFLPIYKGCIYPCDYCYGAPNYQKLLAHRGVVARSAARVVEDLHRLEAMGWVRRVYVVGDFLKILSPEYADEVLGTTYNLGIYYEYYEVPRPEDILKLARAFKGEKTFSFFTGRNHAANSVSGIRVGEIVDPARLAKTLGATVRINVPVDQLRGDDDFLAACKAALVNARGLDLVDSSLWYLRTPDPHGAAQERPQDLAWSLEESKGRPLSWTIREVVVRWSSRGDMPYKWLWRLNTIALKAKIASLYYARPLRRLLARFPRNAAPPAR